MTTTIALFGAGGKMGFRCAERLAQDERFQLRCVEVGAAGIERLRGIGLTTTAQESAVHDADVAVLALPDRVLGAVTAQIAPLMKPGAMIMTLDPAAAHAGLLTVRPELRYTIAHPCHPPLINDETGAARMDFFGGTAKQHIVAAVMQGDESDYALCEAIGRLIFGPVMNCYRVTVEQMAILEPALVETTIMTCLSVIREAIDEAVKAGVPAEAAREFAIGHVNVGVGVLLGYSSGVFSDAALIAIERGKKMLLKDDWRRVFEPESVLEQVRAITK
jgi:ketol-acid reductoisomerase